MIYSLQMNGLGLLSGPKCNIKGSSAENTCILRFSHASISNRMFYFDLHCHSIASDDSRASVEQYLKWIKRLREKGSKIDGIVLTEHRQFDFSVDYSELSDNYQTVVLKGAELDTKHGHFLVYGVSKEMTEIIDFSDVNIDSFVLMEIAKQTGAIAIPAHPGRSGIGLSEWMKQGIQFPTTDTVERLNGGNRPEEAEIAQDLALKMDYRGTGGSDAHFVSAIAKCMTAFENEILKISIFPCPSRLLLVCISTL